MTASDPKSPDRFRFLATFLAGRSLGVTEARAGEVVLPEGTQLPKLIPFERAR